MQCQGIGNNVDYFVLYTSVFQSIAVVTLGDKQMAQRIDNLEGADEFKRFYLQVSLAPNLLSLLRMLAIMCSHICYAC